MRKNTTEQGSEFKHVFLLKIVEIFLKEMFDFFIVSFYEVRIPHGLKPKRCCE